MMQYLFELTVIHTVFLLVYWVLLKKEPAFKLRRGYLIVSLLLSLIIPLLDFSVLFIGNDIGMKSQTVTTYFHLMAPFTIGQHLTISAQPFNTQAFLWIYFLISGFFLFQVIVQILQILRLRRSSKVLERGGIRVHMTPLSSGSFTFFNWIFIGKQLLGTSENIQPILIHEQWHVRLGHSYDILLLQLFKSLFWWLPGAWYGINEIKKIHEYQADAAAASKIGLEQYSQSLIRTTLQINGLRLASSFHDGSIAKRLITMKENSKSIKKWKIGVVTSLFIAIVFTFSCNEELDKSLTEMGENSYQISFDELPSELQVNFADNKESLIFTRYRMDDMDPAAIKSRLVELDAMHKLDKSTIHSVSVLKDDKEVIVVLQKDGSNMDQVLKHTKTEDEIFTIVDELPEFPGGKEGLYKYLTDQLIFPDYAKKNGIEGKVYVQFIVNQDGSVGDVHTIKGIDPVLNKEAERVVAASPKFKPGRQEGKTVKVKMVLPIVFSLSGNP